MESEQTHLDTLVSVQVNHGSTSCNGDDEERGRKELITDNVGETRRSSGEEIAASSSSSTTVEIVKDEERRSNASLCSVEVDLELGMSEKVVHLSEYEKDCRICHMSLDASNLESGVPIELGCSCKDDLAAAHKHCAETWFKIKGNK